MFSMYFFLDGTDRELSTAQTLILTQCVKRVREVMMRQSADHRDLHGSVSKVGKAIDRVSQLHVVQCFNFYLFTTISKPSLCA